MHKQEAKRALKRAADGSGELQLLDSGARTNSEEALPKAEVIRRLRLLGQPASLFGEVSLNILATCQPSVGSVHACMPVTSLPISQSQGDCSL